MKSLQINFSELYQPNKAAFDRYRDLLIKWNSRFNLTAIDRPDEIEELHFLDSISILAVLPSLQNVSRETLQSEVHVASILDIGAGAGFPGIPIKIVRPEIDLTLVDSVKKKCDFMKEVVRALRLESVQVVHERLMGDEQVGQFDLIISRAAFKMPDLIRYGVRNVKNGGLIVGMKTASRGTALATARGGSQGEEVLEEIRECDPLLQQHKLSPIEQYYYTLPVSGKIRSLLITRKA